MTLKLPSIRKPNVLRMVRAVTPAWKKYAKE